MTLRAVFASIPLAAALLVSHTAQAATLTATSTSEYYSSFTITFDDTDGDKLFDIAELVSFSGITDLLYGIDFDALYAVPDVPGFTQEAAGPGGFDPGVGNWGFSAQSGYFAAPQGDFTYRLTFPVAPVPLPGGLFLLGSALAGLGILRRRSRHIA